MSFSHVDSCKWCCLRSVILVEHKGQRLLYIYSTLLSSQVNRQNYRKFIFWWSKCTVSGYNSLWHCCDNKHSPNPFLFTISIFKSRIINDLKSTQTMILIICFFIIIPIITGFPQLLIDWHFSRRYHQTKAQIKTHYLFEDK